YWTGSCSTRMGTCHVANIMTSRGAARSNLVSRSLLKLLKNRRESLRRMLPLDSSKNSVKLRLQNDLRRCVPYWGCDACSSGVEAGSVPRLATTLQPTTVIE